MRFKQYGRTHQLLIENADDLRGAVSLDESLWMATSAPIDAFRCDPRLTALLVDGDKSTRVTSDELKAAIRWFLGALSDTSRIAAGCDNIPLTALNTEAPEGQSLADAARYILKTQAAESEESIDLIRVRRFLEELAQQPFNGDSVIVPEATDDADLKTFIQAVLDCTGGIADAAGKPGVSEENLRGFMDAARAYLDWRKQSRLEEGADASDLMPFGEQTPARYDVLRRHAPLVDHYFQLCRTLRFDLPEAERVAKDDYGLKEADLTDTASLQASLAKAPAATPRADCSLPLATEKLNPAHVGSLDELRREVLEPALTSPVEALSEDQWRTVNAMFGPYGKHLAAKAGASVEKIAPETLTAYLESDLLERALELVARDRRVGTIRHGAEELERLLLYHSHLLPLANNFVSFSHLYATNERAMFERGSLVIDGRWFNLALKVTDVKSHTAIATTSSIFTMYLEVSGTAGDPKFHICVPATSGSKGNLGVGKRGVFFDVNGREYDARVTSIIENPISLREALVAPFIRLWHFILGKIEAMSGSSEKDLQKQADALLKAPPAAGGKSALAGPSALLMSLSVSAAAVGSAFAFITKTLTGMTQHQVLLGLLGAAAVVMVPVSLTAFVKLQRRDLSSLLEGCGWAVNARMRLSRAQRLQFTQAKPYPAGAEGAPPPRNVWGWVTVAVIAIVASVMMYRSCTGPKTELQGPPPPPAATDVN